MKKENKRDDSVLDSDEKYLARLADFSDFYLHLVIFSGAAVAAAIVISVVSNVLLGIALAFFTASIYTYFSANELKKQLGISYKSVRGGIVITKAVAAYGDRLYIPRRLMWSDVTEIADGAVASTKNEKLVAIYIPRSVERIGKDIFGNMSVRAVIYYEASREDWERVDSLTSFEDMEIIFDTKLPELPPKPKKKRGAHRDGEADA